MSIEETIAAVLEAKLAPLRAEFGRLRVEIESLRRALPPVLVTLPEAARVLGLSLSTVRRRVKDGSLPVRSFGRGLRVDLAALHPPAEAEVTRLAAVVKHG